jgi:hypothetical protein
MRKRVEKHWSEHYPGEPEPFSLRMWLLEMYLEMLSKLDRLLSRKK